MPITPFHFGPGALLHAVAPRQVSFLAYCAANVLIDLESLYNLVNDRHPVHAFLHTYVGATLVIPATVLFFLLARRLASGGRLPRTFGWTELTLVQVGLGAAAGAWSHVLLDSVMHHDIRPLSPFSLDNALRGALDLDLLHVVCAAAGLAGAVIVAAGAKRIRGRIR
jgi:membrane-bound metal-dependent hydrolase YbcI (DUF457 family)